jgi:hypothetical protein
VFGGRLSRRTAQADHGTDERAEQPRLGVHATGPYLVRCLGERPDAADPLVAGPALPRKDHCGESEDPTMIRGNPCTVRTAKKPGSPGRLKTNAGPVIEASRTRASGSDGCLDTTHSAGPQTP